MLAGSKGPPRPPEEFKMVPGVTERDPGGGTQASSIETLTFSAMKAISLSTGSVPEDPKAQVALAFANLEKILKAAGATLGDVVKLSISVKTFELRDEINVQWLRAFPDEHSRPARHVVKYDNFGGTTALQIEAYAVVG